MAFSSTATTARTALNRLAAPSRLDWSLEDRVTGPCDWCGECCTYELRGPRGERACGSVHAAEIIAQEARS